MKKAAWLNFVKEDRRAAFIFDLTEKMPRGPHGRRTKHEVSDICADTAWTSDDFENFIYDSVEIISNLRVVELCSVAAVTRTEFDPTTGERKVSIAARAHLFPQRQQFATHRINSVRWDRLYHRIAVYNRRREEFLQGEKVYGMRLGRGDHFFYAPNAEAAVEKARCFVDYFANFPNLRVLLNMSHRDKLGAAVRPTDILLVGSASKGLPSDSREIFQDQKLNNNAVITRSQMLRETAITLTASMRAMPGIIQ